MLAHRRALARSRIGRLHDSVAPLQHRPYFSREPELLQTTSQTLSYPIRTLHGGASRYRNQHHPRTQRPGETPMPHRLQPYAGGEPREPHSVGGLQACAQRPALVANGPAPARRIGEAGCERQSREGDMIMAAALTPAVTPATISAFILRNRRRAPARRASARHPLAHARLRALACRLRDWDFPPPLPEGSARLLRPACESPPWTEAASPPFGVRRAPAARRALAVHRDLPVHRDLVARRLRARPVRDWPGS